MPEGILRRTGSLYMHSDPRMRHHLKLVTRWPPFGKDSSSAVGQGIPTP